MIETPRSQFESLTPQEKTRVIPATSVIIFDGDSFLAFRFAKGTTVGEGKVGIPGGPNDIDLKTGDLESGYQTGVREIREETALMTKPESLSPFDGNNFTHDMGKNGSSKIMDWTLYYSHEFSGEIQDLQPDEGRAEWMKIQDFFNLPDEKVAPNAKLALLYALIHSANN